MTNPMLVTAYTPRPAGPRHDSLHMMDGLQYCWCNCPRCFLRYGETSRGICICRECPCQASYEARRPIYVPRTVE